MTLKAPYYIFAILCSIWSCSCSVSSDNQEINTLNTQSFFSANYSDSIVEIALSFDLDSLIERKNNEEEIRAYLEFTSSPDSLLPLKLRVRGMTRKNICAFPPIRLNFSKETLALNNWKSFDKYKLVTHCLTSEIGDELLLREYLVYKLYEHISEIGFRTQLLNVIYKTPLDTINRFAFIIENEEEHAERLGLSIMDIEETDLKNIHFEQYKIFVLFQYMIGNTDWNLSGGHNTRFVLDEESRTPIVIPYDFDNAGLVNASYARPHPSMPNKNVRERHLLYRGKISDDFSPIKTLFLDKKELIYSTILDFSLITQATKTDMIAYIQEFYDIIEQDNWKSMVFPK